MIRVKKLKSNVGNSSIEIIVWFSIVMVLSTAFFSIRTCISDYSIVESNTNNLVNTESIADNQNNTIIKEENKVPITQHITINNIQKDGKDNLFYDFNINVLSDIASNVVIILVGFFIGKFTKKKTVSLKKH